VTSLRDSISAVADQQVQYGISKLEQAYKDKLQAELFLNSVNSMRESIQKGGDGAAASNALALTLLKTQIYAAFEGSNTVQVQNLPEAMGTTISTVNAVSMVADLDALKAALNSRAAQLDTSIAALSQSIQNGSDISYLGNAVALSSASAPVEKTIAEAEQKIRDLNASINTLTARETELTKARDLAWQSYSALETKGMEMSVAAQTTGSEVVFASMATPPNNKIVHGGMNALVSSAIGLLIGLVIAYFYEFWQSYKGRRAKSISSILLNIIRDLFRKRSVKSPLNPA
jgi:hypothetical protein